MYRNIVILLDDHPAQSNVLDVAINMAKSSDGQITGVYVLPFSPTMFFMPDAVDVESIHKKEKEVQEEFESTIDAADVKGEWHYTEGGDVVKEVAQRGLYADLIVLGRDESNNSIVDKIILTASCPTLLLPTSKTSNGVFDNVIVAWKNTREAARALHDTLPLLHSASDITIVTFGEPDDQEKHSLNSYLKSHGINVSINQQSLKSFPAERSLISDIDASIGDRLLTFSKEEGRDLIIMGAYGHSRLSEAVLSGVTHQVSRNAEIPVLMSH